MDWKLIIIASAVSSLTTMYTFERNINYTCNTGKEYRFIFSNTSIQGCKVDVK